MKREKKTEKIGLRVRIQQELQHGIYGQVPRIQEEINKKNKKILMIP